MSERDGGCSQPSRQRGIGLCAAVSSTDSGRRILTPYSLLFFSADSDNSKPWRPLLLVVTSSLEELPLTPMHIGRRVTGLSQWSAVTLPGMDTVPHLQCWVLFHSSSSVSLTLFSRGSQNTAIMRIFYCDNYRDPNENKLSRILHKRWRQRVAEYLEVAHIALEITASNLHLCTIWASEKVSLRRV